MNNFAFAKGYQKHGGYLAYWLANTSEFVLFLKHDRDYQKSPGNIQVRLVESIRRSFFYLIRVFKNELYQYLIVFTNPKS